jgi:hypothetical protein
VHIPGDVPSCISASANGRWLVSGSFQGIVCLWDVISGRCVATLLGHEACVLCIDISDCGSIVASCSDDNATRIWRLKDRAWSRPIVLQHDKRVNCILLSADGSRAITGDEGGVVRVWDAETGVLCEPVLLEHVTEITTLAVDCSQVTRGDSRSPGVGLCLASRCANGTRLLWSWPCKDSVKSSSEIPFEQPLQPSCHVEFDVTGTSRWREQRYWWKDRPDTFIMRASTETSSPGCAVGYDRTTNCVFEVLPNTPRPDGCECVARVELDTVIQHPTVHAFERREGGVLKTIACCGLRDGTLAVFELVRLPEQGFAQPL